MDVESIADFKVISPIKTVKLRQSIEQLETIAGIQPGFEELKGLTLLLLVSLHEKCSKNVEFQVEIAPVGEVEVDRGDRCWRSGKLMNGIELEQTGKEGT